MNISISSIMAGFVFGVIGFWMFKEGKKNSNFQTLLIGMALMIYPYFTNGPKMDWGVGILLCTLAYYLW